MKRKLYFSIVLVLLPSVLYLVVFFMNDPHAYFGDSSETVTDSLIDNMLDWKNGAYNALIIGDSRMTSFDEEYMAELDECTGLTFKNMSYGGGDGDGNELSYPMVYGTKTRKG